MQIYIMVFNVPFILTQYYMLYVGRVAQSV
jgi:hypothetical protein